MTSPRLGLLGHGLLLTALMVQHGAAETCFHLFNPDYVFPIGTTYLALAGDAMKVGVRAIVKKKL